MPFINNIPEWRGRIRLAGAPAGFDALVLAQLAGERGDVLFVARDAVRLARTAEALSFFAPELEVIDVPAWDCLPYDRVSPNADVASRRLDGLTRLLDGAGAGPGRVILTTVAALMQRVPARDTLRGTALSVRTGGRLAMEDLVAVLERSGYQRADTVAEPGEYAVRGGIVDVFPPGAEDPVRVDFFGDEVDDIRRFDPMSQRSGARLEQVVLKPVSEVLLTEDSISRFRTGYRSLFGHVAADDPLYEAVSAGRRALGLEHWLPLFHERLETLADYAPEAPVVLDDGFETARDARLEEIREYYEARRSFETEKPGLSGAPPYHPVPPDSLFLGSDELAAILAARPVAELSPFAAPDDAPGAVDAGGRPGHGFAEARANPDVNVFDAVREHLAALGREGRRVVIAAWSAGSRDRLASVLAEHGLERADPVDGWQVVRDAPDGRVAVAVLGIEHGFVADGLAVVTEQDILGDRMVRPARRRMRAENFIASASSLSEGDLVVHIDHGIGRYQGLETLDVAGAPHDCLCVVYEGNDRLFIPVENIEVLSRYGSDQGAAQLDRLGGAAWQARKARLKERIRDMADGLIRVAAARQLQAGSALLPPEGVFDEFASRFPYAETDDQARAIDAVLDDLRRGRPMDRLVCGDVGFGKTEVALRAAFVAAMNGFQVAVIVPTTLLCRQHFSTFRQRFAGFPLRIEQLSRLVTGKEARQVREGLADGTVDIVVGTHTLLAKGVEFRRLGLLVVDEEQHFGVSHKEKLKQLKAGVHVLTLTATPIPRTLQMALTGVKEMSLIATPPVDRLAVRTYVLPFDPVVVREAILRERQRGGQTFYVCPRIADIDRVAGRLAELVPEARVIVAHGRMAPSDLERAMEAFSQGRADVLLSTNIIESGLDLPGANTLIVHRADMFGLAQLYQLRGRVGRSKLRAYAYLTLPPRQKVSPAAERRLQVMQTLDTLGAGFTLASHDLDIRGAGNLLGEEQSGHIREVGIELYQQMLEEAVANARAGEDGAPAPEEAWSPQIGIGMPVLIPDGYVADLNLRLDLYRRLGGLTTREELDSFAAELTDRFGPLPAEVENLLEIVALKLLCRAAGVEKVDAGPKGAVVSFRSNQFANPAGLVDFIGAQSGTARLRPDHKLVVTRAWERPADRLRGVQHLVKTLAGIAGGA